MGTGKYTATIAIEDAEIEKEIERVSRNLVPKEDFWQRHDSLVFRLKGTCFVVTVTRNWR